MHRTDKCIGWPTLAALSLVVIALMGLSLLVTATGTARFAAAMGYDANVGYAVGAVFDLAKGILPVALAVLLGWRMLGTAASFGAAWLCLVVFSCLATHATVSTAISAIERAGAWQMEARGNTKAELASVEQQLAALSRPGPPRPAKTVQEALAAERVPASVWHDSQECSRLQESAYFSRACRQVVELRRELAAALDYERLSLRASELRKDLAQAPIVATSDPLPAAFSTTLGRVLPLSGTEGVALLLTVVVEIMSSFGLVGVTALYRTRIQWSGAAGKPAKGSLTAGTAEAEQREGNLTSLPPPRTQALSNTSPRASQEECQTLPVHSPKTASPGVPKPSLKAVAIGLQTLPDTPSLGAVAVESQTLPEPSRACGDGKENGHQGAFKHSLQHPPLEGDAVSPRDGSFRAGLGPAWRGDCNRLPCVCLRTTEIEVDRWCINWGHGAARRL
jgi:hypothetical protein